MASRATTTPAPEYDFDAWTEEDENKAIAALVPKIRYIIVEKTFVGRFEDGVIVKMPLSLSLDDVDALQAEQLAPVDQFKTLLTRLGGEEAAAEFTRHDLIETSALAGKFFDVLQRVQRASLPE